MTHNTLICGLMAVPLALAAACTPAQVAQTTQIINTVQADVGKAVELYGIAKGMAEQAAKVANPALAAKIQAGIAQTDRLVAVTQQVVTAGVADAQTVAALANTITIQANGLTAAAAPVVRVVPVVGASVAS